ncbi:hypothetical protein [Pelagibius sp.]|uniref:hypothetical protein n=1 Tax=Pelagibius sp. TaxID=1931238 RepID=UPI003B504BA8
MKWQSPAVEKEEAFSRIYEAFNPLQHDPEHLDAHAVAIDKHCEQLLVKESWAEDS